MKRSILNARKLRGIYFIDLEDKEFKETIENARKKLETFFRRKVKCQSRQIRPPQTGQPNPVQNRLYRSERPHWRPSNSRMREHMKETTCASTCVSKTMDGPLQHLRFTSLGLDHHLHELCRLAAPSVASLNADNNQLATTSLQQF